MKRLTSFAVCLTALLLISTACTAKDAVGSEAGQILEQYRSLGAHRSGTETDLATAQWLHGELRVRGVNAELQQWPLRVFDLVGSSIQTDDATLDAFPFWYPVATGSSGIQGALVDVTAGWNSKVDNPVAFYRLPPGQFEFHFDIAPLASTWAEQGAEAAVVVLDHPIKAVSAQNANKPHHQQALPLPVVIASESDAEKLQELAAKQSPVKVIIDGTSRDGTARNVLGWLDRNAARWLVISTPISGWFEVTNERGPGIALWLELARWAAEEDIRANVLFAGLSGHELGKMGMDALVASGRLPKPPEVCLWLHLGSGIAVKTPLLAAVSSAAELEEATRTTLVDHTSMAYWPEQKMPKGSEQYGALQLGYPVVGLFGGGPAIHTRLDQ
ncbi:MAG: hypothetical protein V2I48_08860, partial [Xanthomonadales bacterium]|nr:hypothetical protein [Xanthomonadales bacterium]